MSPVDLAKSLADVVYETIENRAGNLCGHTQTSQGEQRHGDFCEACETSDFPSPARCFSVTFSPPRRTKGDVSQQHRHPVGTP